MSKFRYETVPQRAEEWIKEGRGKGTGKDYKPWLLVQNLSSQGNSNRVPGLKIDREFHVFSLNEEFALDIFQLSPQVVDIREQYPLTPMIVTEEIAERLNIDHPNVIIKKERVNVMMTTDFVITLLINGKEQIVALTVKEKTALGVYRTIEKLEIERNYWRSRNTPWGIIIAEDMPRELKINAHKLADYYRYDLLQINHADLSDIHDVLTPSVLKKESALRLLARESDRKLGLKVGTSLSAAKHFAATRTWLINWHVLFDADQTVDILGAIKYSYQIPVGDKK